MSDDKAVAWGVARDGVLMTYRISRNERRVKHWARSQGERDRSATYTVVPLYSAPREATTGGGDGARELRNAAWAAVGECGLNGTIDALETAVRAYDALLDSSRGEGGKERAFREAAVRAGEARCQLSDANTRFTAGEMPGHDYGAMLDRHAEAEEAMSAAYLALKSRSPRAGERGGGE